MVVTDLDRTLLRSDHSLSDYTVSVLNTCRKHGIKIVFATARDLSQMMDLLAKVPADAVIAINGAIIYVDGKVVIENRILEYSKQRIQREFYNAEKNGC